MSGKTITEMTAEVREVNTAKGWRTDTNTLGDYIALAHSEVSEALEAYRDHRLADATATTRAGTPISGAKPDGVGSEFADVLVRLIDAGDVFDFWFSPNFTLDNFADLDPHFSDPKLPELITFGDYLAWLDRRIDRIWTDTTIAPMLALRALVTITRKYGIDLDAEYARKMAYNRTRPYQHGGRTLSGDLATVQKGQS